MTNEELLEELKALAAELAVPLRFETGNFDGGACTVNGERVIILNRKSTVPQKIGALAEGLAECGIEGVFVKPAVREAIEDELAKQRIAHARPGGNAAPATQ